MPLQQIVPTWTTWNNANFTSPTGLTDLRTGQPFAAGGLNLGDYFDATEQEANQSSYPTIGTLHSGRYRFVQVDAGASSGDVAVGRVGFVRQGTFIQSVIITVPGTLATPGTYNLATSTAGGTAGLIQVVVNSSGVISAATVLQPGFGFTSLPTVSLTSTGTSLGAVTLQLNTTPNIVTSADIAATANIFPNRPVVFLNTITPGNYGFVQELGVATVLGNATAAASLPAFVNVVSGNTTTGGLCASVVIGTQASPISSTIGMALDLPYASLPYKVYLQYVPVCQD